MHYVAVSFIVISICIGFITGDITGPVPYQSTCDPSGSGACSTSQRCQCATVTTTGEHICTQQMSCQFSDSCGAGDSCAKNGTVCVNDSRCPGLRLCYSTVLFSPELCPASSSADAKK